MAVHQSVTVHSYCLLIVDRIDLCLAISLPGLPRSCKQLLATCASYQFLSGSQRLSAVLAIPLQKLCSSEHLTLPRAAQETPPQHFLTTVGEFGGGDPPFQCGPMGNGSFSVDAAHQLVLNEGATLQAGSPEAEQQLRGGWRNKIAREVRFRHSLDLAP